MSSKRWVGGRLLPGRPGLGGAVAAVVVVAMVGLGFLLERPRHDEPDTSGTTTSQFPPVDRSTLTPARARIVDVLEAQWRSQPAAPTFTEGSDEPWCADFVSWVMREAGVPLANPNGGSWRIPGVYTMQEYYQSVGRLDDAKDYRPLPGDVVLWGPDSPMGLHANVVVAVDADTMTTVGGNEGGIALRRSGFGPEAHLLGFGQPA